MARRVWIRYEHEGREETRSFESKAEAFRWFNWECPAGTAVMQEEEPDGGLSPPKGLRRNPNLQA